MNNFFQFESDFVDSLRCIPMQVRMKLDTCGIKLKLSHWHQFTQPERQVLVTMPCSSPEESKIYHDFLQQLVTAKTGTPAGELPIEPYPLWEEESIIPAQVQEKVIEFNITLTQQQWQQLTPLQRYALIKLSRSSHENRNFYPALQEFNLIKS